MDFKCSDFDFYVEVRSEKLKNKSKIFLKCTDMTLGGRFQFI